MTVRRPLRRAIAAAGCRRSSSSSLVVGLWEGLVRALHVQQFLLPKPSTIVSVFWTDRHTLWPAGWYTFKEALGGFAIGSRRSGSSPPRRRPLPAARHGADADLHRGERRPDHRLRPDLRRLVQPDLAALEDGDRRRPLLLPGDGEHAARPAEREARARSS